MMPEAAMIQVIVYAAKSTDQGEGGSLDRQEQRVREAVAAAGDRSVVAAYRDNAASAYHSSRLDGFRGQGMAEAYRHARELADAGHQVEVWVYKTDRLARGDGKGGQHLVQHYFHAQDAGFALRSVTDDEALRNIIMTVVTGEQNHAYSRAISEHGRSKKRQQVEAGRRLGGPVPDGYRSVPLRWDGSGAVIEREYQLDPDRAPIILEAFALSEQGHGDATVARRLTQAGHVTVNGKPWDRRSVQSILTNSIYGGLHRRRGEGGEWELYEATDIAEPMLPTERWRAITAKRITRDRSSAGRARANSRKGRTTSLFALAGIARCRRCGANMYSKKQPKPRVDGSFLRYYVCRNTHDGASACDQPAIHAEVVDPAIVAHLRTYFADFAKWAAALRNASSQEAVVARAEVTRLTQELDQLHAADANGKRKLAGALASGRDDEYAMLRDVLAGIGAQVAVALNMLEAARDRLGELEARAQPTESMLGQWAELIENIWGRIDESSPLGAVNEELRVALDHVMLNTVDDRITIEAFQKNSDTSERSFGAITADRRKPDTMVMDDGTVILDWARLDLPGDVRDYLAGLPERDRASFLSDVTEQVRQRVGPWPGARPDGQPIQEVDGRWEPWHWGFVAGC